jgi:hypothetical protein
MARKKRLKIKVPRVDKSNSKAVSLRSALQSVRTPVLADIKRIRALWAQGHTDREIREDMDLGFREWRRRIQIMRAVPPDDDTVHSYKRYFYEHSKAVEKLQQRLATMYDMYNRAKEEVTIYGNYHNEGKKKGKRVVLMSRPRDLHLAASVLRDMASIDREIVKMEGELITVKQRLGMIELPTPMQDEDPFTDALQITIRAPNIMAAWKLRQERKKQLSEQPVEDAEIVAKNNGKVQAKAKKTSRK